MKNVPSMKQLRATRAAAKRAIKHSTKKLELLQEIEQLRELRFRTRMEVLVQCKNSEPSYAS